MLGKRVVLFRIAGLEVRVDGSWLFLAILIIWSLAQGYFPAQYRGLAARTYWGMGVVGALGLFLCILAHEMTHTAVARVFGLPMKGITLFIFGGVAEMESEPSTPRQEFLIAIAGPALSFALALAFHLVLRLIPEGGVLENAYVPLRGVVTYLAYTNFLLALFNLLPGFPLDGGRCLRAVLWHWSGSLRRATRQASRGGEFLGIGLIVIGSLSFLGGNFIAGVWWFLIGLFLRNTAEAAYEQLVLTQVLQDEPVRHFMNHAPVTVTPDSTIANLVEKYIYQYHHKMFPVTDGRKLVGCVHVRDVKRVPRDEWGRHTVGEIMQDLRGLDFLGPSTEAKQALSIMARTGASRLLVVEGDELVGVIALKDLLKLLSLKMELEDSPAQAA